MLWIRGTVVGFPLRTESLPRGYAWGPSGQTFPPAPEGKGDCSQPLPKVSKLMMYRHGVSALGVEYQLGPDPFGGRTIDIIDCRNH